MGAFMTRDRKAGFIIYPLGDAIAQGILGDLNFLRVIVMSLVGGLIYAVEIPKWFSYIEHRFSRHWLKTFAAILYFNPLWIARHLFFIAIALSPALLITPDHWGHVLWDCLIKGTKSFAGAILLSVIGNFVIQNLIGLKYRFAASSIFSGLMAIYYALSAVL